MRADSLPSHDRRRAVWTGRAAGEQARRGEVRRELACRAERGLDQQRVQRRGPLRKFLCAHDRLAAGVDGSAMSGGMTISRLTILPVAPFGSASTIHTMRGYL